MSLAVRIHEFGDPVSVLRVEEVDVPVPVEGELLVEMLAAPVNPADINVIEGKYGLLPDLPGVVGNEGAGRVIATGTGVEGFSPGDLVLPMERGTWTQKIIARADKTIRLPSGLEPVQAAMLCVNPFTAYGMLTHLETLQSGDWVVQNASNSAVGRCVIQIARILGLKTLNVVRRPELVDELKALGADIVVTEECDLRSEVENLCGTRRPRLALNAVGGASALNLANALADGGCHVTYGAMGRQPLKIPNGQLIFRRLRFIGYWLTDWMSRASQEELQKICTQLAQWMSEDRLRIAVQAEYPLEKALEAVQEAAKGERKGKIVLRIG